MKSNGEGKNDGHEVAATKLRVSVCECVCLCLPAAVGKSENAQLALRERALRDAKSTVLVDHPKGPSFATRATTTEGLQ